MPIFHVELAGAPPPDLARTLADELGALMGSPPGHTWVRVLASDLRDYAENQVGGAASEPPRTVFVRLILRALPEEAALAERARAIAEVVAEATHRAIDDVHVYFDPAAAGRIAFGGALVPRG